MDFVFANAEGKFMHKENILYRVFNPVQKKLKLLRSTSSVASHDGDGVPAQWQHQGHPDSPSP